MHCLILFRDSAGRLPTAQELRRCGFEVSAAALPPADSPLLHAHRPGKPSALALAAEPTTPYGNGVNCVARPAPSVPEQAQPDVAEAVTQPVTQPVAKTVA